MEYGSIDDPNLKVKEGVLELHGPLKNPKLVLDPLDGWLAYLSKDNQLFVKSFKVYPDRVYGDMASPTVSLWYKDPDRIEMEPLGPMESIEPGQTVSFTETWYLYDFPFPQDGKTDIKKIRKMVIPAE